MRARMYPRGSRGLGATVLVAAILLASGPVGAQVTVSMSPDLVVFQQDTEVTVDLVLANTAGVAGVDLTLQFPVERFEGNPTFQEGTLNGLIEVNDETPGELLIVFARATGLVDDAGTLVSFTFSVLCEGNQDFPEGNPVEFTVSEFLAFDESSQELSVDASDITIALKCTGVATEALSFSAVKARFGR